MTCLKNLAAEYASANLAPMMEFRNHNGIYDIKINNKWYYFNPTTKGKYNDTYDEIFYHITTYFKVLSNMLDEQENTENAHNADDKKNNQYNTKKEEIKDIYKKSDCKLINLIAKKIFEYVKKNVPNTAVNNSNDDIPLPVELTDMIFQFVPNDNEMDLVKNLKNKIMLPKEDIETQLIKFLPHIANEPKIIEIYCKYVDLFTTNSVMNLIRNKLCDEFYEKKSFPKNNDGKFLPISKDDFKILKKYVNLDKTTFSDLDQLTTSIHNSMKQLLYSEIKNIRQIKTLVDYNYFKDEFKGECFRELTEIEIFQKIFEFGHNDKFYKNGWKSEIPELLSNTTNRLTTRDVYMIKQYPIWVKCFLEHLSTDVFAMITHFNKLVKYDRSCKSIIERVEKLIKLQNEYEYHNLQKYKNECKNELKKIEKFTK
jgi:hypothetical protein